MIERQVILAIKASEEIHKIYEARLLTYMKAMKKKSGTIDKFQCEKVKRWNKEISFIEVTEGEG